MKNTTSLTLADIYRTQHVKRWHIVHTSRQQTVAEHSYMVAMITLEIAEAVGLDDQWTAIVLKWALVHDLPEVITGDTVSPVKALAKDTFDLIERAVDEGRAAFEKDLPGLVLDIVKAADLIDALGYLQREGLNRQAEVIFKRLYNVFINHIAAAEARDSHLKWWGCCSVLLQMLSESSTFIDEII